MSNSSVEPEVDDLPPELIPQSDPNAKPVEMPAPPQPTDYSERLIIVIPVARKKQAESIAKNADGNLQGEVFTVELSATGEAPATHYWCGWAVTKTQRGILTALPNAANAQFFDMEEYTPEAVLTELGLQRIETDPLV